MQRLTGNDLFQKAGGLNDDRVKYAENITPTGNILCVEVKHRDIVRCTIESMRTG